MYTGPVPVAARSKAWVCDRPLAGITGPNPAEGMDVCLVSDVYCQIGIPGPGWSLVQRRLTDCGVSECDLEIEEAQ